MDRLSQESHTQTRQHTQIRAKEIHAPDTLTHTERALPCTQRCESDTIEKTEVVAEAQWLSQRAQRHPRQAEKGENEHEQRDLHAPTDDTRNSAVVFLLVLTLASCFLFFCSRLVSYVIRDPAVSLSQTHEAVRVLLEGRVGSCRIEGGGQRGAGQRAPEHKHTHANTASQAKEVLRSQNQAKGGVKTSARLTLIHVRSEKQSARRQVERKKKKVEQRCVEFTGGRKRERASTKWWNGGRGRSSSRGEGGQWGTDVCVCVFVRNWRGQEGRVRRTLPCPQGLLCRETESWARDRKPLAEPTRARVCANRAADVKRGRGREGR